MTTTFHRLFSVDAAVQWPREENQEAVQLPAPTEPLTGKKKHFYLVLHLHSAYSSRIYKV